MFGAFSFFDIFLLAIAFYVILAGIRGKGRLFQVDNIKEGMEEEFRSVSRKLYVWLGIAMLINSAASLGRGLLYTSLEVSAATETQAAVYEWAPRYDLGAFSFLTVKVFDWITYIALGATIALLVVLIIKTRKYTDKEAAKAKAAAGAQTSRPAGHVLPVSAFEFDDLETGAGQAAEKPEA